MKLKYIEIYRGRILHKVEVIFPQSLCHYQHFFPPLHEMLYAGCIELFAEASELFTHAVFQLFVIHKNGIFWVRPSGG